MAVRQALQQFQYDTIVRGTNDFIPVTVTRENSETGEITPRDLTGMLAILTVKSVDYDGVRPTDKKTASTAKWHQQLADRSAALCDFDQWNYDYYFRITVDCDDPTEGNDGPSFSAVPAGTEYGDDVWSDNYQGMYGLDPKDGKVIFRLTKKMTFIKPGNYSFDIRFMEKERKIIGEVKENRNWAPIFGKLTIQGTPTNRTQYDVLLDDDVQP